MIKVMIVDDQTLLKETLQFMLTQDEDIDAFDGGNNGIEAIKLAKTLEPDVILMDLRMPLMGGMDAARRIKAVNKDIKIIFLTTFEDEGHIRESISMGADGYIVKDIKPEVLILAVKSAHAGLHVMHQHVITNIREQMSRNKTDKSRADELIDRFELTESDIEIIRLLADGKSNKEIGEELSLVEGTIKNKVSKILSKIGLKDRTQVVVFAIKENII